MNSTTKNGRFSFPVRNEDFQKSSYSDPGGIIKTCVEVARTPQGVAVRDSKQPSGSILFFTNDEWKAFIRGAQEHQFDN